MLSKKIFQFRVSEICHLIPAFSAGKRSSLLSILPISCVVGKVPVLTSVYEKKKPPVTPSELGFKYGIYNKR